MPLLRITIHLQTQRICIRHHIRQTNSISFNPQTFPTFLPHPSLPKKIALKIDSRKEIIHEGALKKERE